MSSAVGRLATILCFIACIFLSASHASHATPETSLEASHVPSDEISTGVTDDNQFFNETILDLRAANAVWQPAIDGYKPLQGVQDRSAEIEKRACLANGTNFCFGDQVNYCANCGICCGSGSTGYCCGTDQTCCGTACCASGQTCSNGKCLLPIVTVTVTSATRVIVSRLATEVVTVLQAVVQTSTVFSTVEVTVSTGGTQTDITYVTVTVGASGKRAVSSGAPLKRDPDTDISGFWATLSHFTKRFSFGWSPQDLHQTSAWRLWDQTAIARLARRDVIATKGTAAAAAGSTTSITAFVTETSIISNIISTTTTVPTTSIAMTTIVQTKTKVLNAQTTIQVTSTITITSQPPTTQTITQTATASFETTATSATSSATSTTAAASGGGGSSGLSTTAIAGIAGGIGGALVLVGVAVALFFWRRRQQNRAAAARDDPSSYLDPYIPAMTPTIPRLGPSPPQFSPSAPHHGAPAPISSDAAYAAGGAAAAAGLAAGRDQHQQHNRTSSGMTTLAGTPVGGKAKDPRFSMNTPSTAAGNISPSPDHQRGSIVSSEGRHPSMTGAGQLPNMAEAPGVEWYEVEGSGPGAAGVAGQPGQQQHLRQGSSGAAGYQSNQQQYASAGAGAGAGAGYGHASPGVEELDSTQQAAGARGQYAQHQRQGSSSGYPGAYNEMEGSSPVPGRTPPPAAAAAAPPPQGRNVPYRPGHHQPGGYRDF